MMRYLKYDFLRDHGLQHFDNWVSVFGEQKTDWELAPAGNKFKERMRIANYTGLPELMGNKGNQQNNKGIQHIGY